jgi:serine/threonine protein kinase
MNPEGFATCVRCGGALRSLDVGSVLAGRYELLSVLGRGGMGVVYRAHDKELDEVVAIKVLRADTAGSADAEKRFRSEIKLARRVRHRNVCGIHEYGRDGAYQYIAMELVPGVDLRHVLHERGALPASEAFDVALQVAYGLAAIHGAGIVHRDLKASNLMRDEHGVVRLMDFGIAKAFGVESTSATATGVSIGTPEYMSPEQVRGDVAIDARSDLYALGILIFNLFTGRLPFQADTPVAMLFKQLQEPPPLSGAPAERLPQPLLPILAKLLAKNRDERYGSAQEVIDALREARDTVAPLPRTQPAPSPLDVRPLEPTLPEPPQATTRVPSATMAVRRRSPVLPIVGGATGLLALGLLAWFVLRKAPPLPPSPFPDTPPATTVPRAASVAGPATIVARPVPQATPTTPIATPVPTPVALPTPVATALPRRVEATPPPVVSTPVPLPVLPERTAPAGDGQSVGFVVEPTRFQAPEAAAPGLAAPPPGVVVHAAQPASPKAQLVVEAEPARVRAGETFTLRYSIFNISAAPLTIGSVSVRNGVAGAGVTGGPVEPRTRSAAPRARTLLVQTSGTWVYDASTAWTSAFTVVLEDGSVYRTTLRAQP